MADILVTMTETRENLLREYVIAKGAEKATVLAKILEIEAEIESEKKETAAYAAAVLKMGPCGEGRGYPPLFAAHPRLLKTVKCLP